jgi:hypothetical protein
MSWQNLHFYDFKYVWNFFLLLFTALKGLGHEIEFTIFDYSEFF